MNSNRERTIHKRPWEMLQNLIRFDTTNPPGKEAECIYFINDLLKAYNFQTEILAKDPERPNLIARLSGRGDASPLLLYGHVDVVTTANQGWTQPPFEGKIIDGYVWGRGALDMKSGVVMMLSALLRAKLEGLSPAGDVIFAALSDEEAGGEYGAKFLVEECPEQFAGVRYALGEFGGITIYLRGQKLYPIQVAEKQRCWMKVTFKGPGGHGALPMRGGAVGKAAHFLVALDRKRFPVHITPVVQQMVEKMASVLPAFQQIIFHQVLNPIMTDAVLGILGSVSKPFEPLLRNTVNATLLHSGEKINVIPSEVELELDGRLLPGFDPSDIIREMQNVTGMAVEVDILHHEPAPDVPDMGLFDKLASILKEADPSCTPIPMLLPAVTDARYFCRLGIQTYGFTPMKLPEDFAFFDLVHGTDERIPVEALEFGSNAIFEVLKHYA